MFFNSEAILPNWTSELLKLVAELGESRTFVSIYENGSQDDTKSLLRDLAAELSARGVLHNVTLSDRPPLNRAVINRVEYLSQSRNMAMDPLFSGQAPRQWFAGATCSKILFFNDIYWKAADALRLLRTHRLNYDMACGLDFYWSFYDAWVTRDVQGQKFGDMYPFVSDPTSQSALRRGEAFRVACCWNGLAIMSVAPFLKDGVRFRGTFDSNRPACYMSECFYICHDFWRLGHRRIYVNPLVKVAYDWKKYFLHNYVTPWVEWILYRVNSKLPPTDPEFVFDTQAAFPDPDGCRALWDVGGRRVS